MAHLQRTANRTCGFPASGFPTGFIVRPTAATVRARAEGSLDGKRAHLLFHPVTMFPVARALHSPAGATIGEIFTFLSGLYFRGKLAYAEAFARPPAGLKSGVFVITPKSGAHGQFPVNMLTSLVPFAED